MEIFILTDTINWLKANLLDCPVKKYLHIPCPGCGMQRSFVALLQGNIPLSVQYHAATLPVLLFFLFAALQLVLKFRHGNKLIVHSYLYVASIIVCNYIYRLTFHILT